MLCSKQMATKAGITAEQYLHMTSEHDYIHGRTAFLIAQALVPVSQSHPLYPCFAVQMQVAPDVYLIPDVAVFAGAEPKQNVPFDPPLVVIEIISEDDRYSDLVDKLERCCVWGVPNVWIVDPLAKQLVKYSDWGFNIVSSLAVAEYLLELTPVALFSDL
jgi:Uma2 family endonuclease